MQVIFLQSPVMIHHNLRMRYAHITKGPRLVRDPGNGLFSRRVSFNQSVIRSQFPEYLANPLIGKVWAEKVKIRLLQA